MCYDFSMVGLTNLLMADFMILPAKGQSNEQLEKDKFSCYGWAKQQSGFDPMKAPTISTHHHPSNRNRAVLPAVRWVVRHWGLL